MNIERNKFYKTRNGKRVQIYSTEAGGTSPIHGAVHDPGNGWVAGAWGANGFVVGPSHAHPIDIIGEYTDQPARYVAYINPLGMIGMFDEQSVPEDIKASGVRAPWLDQYPAKYQGHAIPKES